MEYYPVLHVGFIAYEQGFKAVEPGVGALNGCALAAAFGIEAVAGGGFARHRTRVMSNVSFDVAPEASLAQGTGIKATVGVHKKTFERYLRFSDCLILK